MTSPPSADTPQGRRRERVAARLREALTTLEADPAVPVTVAALTRLAGVGRNALYDNHRSILAALRAVQLARHRGTVDPASPDAVDGRAELVARLRALATQNAGLLRRALVAEERAAKLEARNADLVRALEAMRKPVVMAGREALAPGL